jgi:hypothetical protein
MEHFTDFQSTTIRRISYDEKSSTLEVEFHNGSSYQYFDVPSQIWEAFKTSDSKGKFIHENLKGHYRYSRV